MTFFRRPKAAFVCDVVTPTGDPTGTFDLRRRYGGEAEQRFRKVRAALMTAVIKQDVLGLKPETVSPLAKAASPGNAQQGFQTWLDNLLKKVVIENDGAWMRPMLSTSYARAIKRAMRLTKNNAIPDDAQQVIDTLQALALTELQGICEAVSQRIMRGASLAWLHDDKPVDAFKDMDVAISAVGITRSKAMIELMVVKAFSTATLDQFAAAGIKKVGLVPETVPKSKKDSIPFHDAGTAAFTKEGMTFGGFGSCQMPATTGPFDNPLFDNSAVWFTKGGLTSLDLAKKALEAAPVVPVRLRMLKSWQPLLDRPEFIAPLSKDYAPLMVYKIGGKFILENGNHRAVSAWLEGRTTINAHMLDLDLEANAQYLTEASRKMVVRDAPFGGTGPGSRTSREVAPSRRTVQRIRASQRNVESLGQVNVQTAGDEDVCPICQDIEDDNPYSINEARSLIPAHPRCRCAFVPLNEGDDIDVEVDE